MEPRLKVSARRSSHVLSPSTTVKGNRENGTCTYRNDREDWRSLPRKWGMDSSRHPFNHRTDCEGKYNAPLRRQSGNMEIDPVRLMGLLAAKGVRFSGHPFFLVKRVRALRNMEGTANRPGRLAPSLNSEPIRNERPISARRGTLLTWRSSRNAANG